MKQNLKPAVNLTALVLAAGLLMGLFTGCPHKPKEEPKPQNVTITVKGDANVTINEPKTLEVVKGTKWSEVKAKVKVSYKTNYEAAGFKLDSESGIDLKDDYAFNENKTVFALSKAPTPEKVTIIIKGDANVTVNEPKTLEVAKGSKWNEVKAKVKVNYKDGFEAKGWKLDGASGQDLEDGYAFNENKTIFALSKIKGITYKVEHLRQNIADDNYTLCETETLSGKDGETTSAAAKTYDGFTAQAFSQAAIKADSSTVVQIKYNRNIIALKLNLDGGTTTTPLTDGEGGTKLLKGKFGAKVELENLKKGSDILDVWTPELPSTFPASSPDTTYAASWIDKYRITVKGDERTAIPSDNIIKIDLAPAKTWQDIQGDVANKVILKSEWPGGDYEVYEWRLDDENGTKLTGDYQIKSHITVYAVTNYAKFNIEGTKIKLTSDGKGCTGEAPKGKIIIPNGITEIEGATSPSNGAFKDCTEISSVKFPQTLTTIGWFAFSGCTGLTSLDLSACTSLTTIDGSAFSGCTGLKSIRWPANLTTIGENAFFGCTGLKSLDLSGCTSLTIIYNWTFKDCTGLTSISLPTSLVIIDWNVFEGCKSLTSISLPANLTRIGSQVFYGCTSLTSISLPANLTQIGYQTFSGCTGLTSLTVDSRNTKYKSIDNIIYTKDGETLVAAAGSLRAVNIPDTVTTIYGGAFSGCTGLTSISLPANLTTIGYEAFENCTELTSAVFADKEGWKVYYDNSYSDTPTSISSSDLADASKAAKYLRQTYVYKYWKKD